MDKKRYLADLTKEELDVIKDLLKDNYYNHSGKADDLMIRRGFDVYYQVFSKSRSLFSGFEVVKVYEYLKSLGIDPAIRKPGLDSMDFPVKGQ